MIKFREILMHCNIIMQEKQHGFIGINVYSIGFSPLTESTKDEIATQRANDFFLGW